MSFDNEDFNNDDDVPDVNDEEVIVEHLTPAKDVAPASPGKTLTCPTHSDSRSSMSTEAPAKSPSKTSPLPSASKQVPVLSTSKATADPSTSKAVPLASRATADPTTSKPNVDHTTSKDQKRFVDQSKKQG